MLLSLFLLFTMISTPIATPMVLSFTQEWIDPLGSSAASQPLIENDVAYIATTSGVIMSYNTGDGSVRWQEVIDAPPSDDFVLDQGQILIPGANGSLIVQNADDGTIASTIVISSAQLVKPLIYGDTLVVADRTGVVSILDRESLEIEWQYVLDGDLHSYGLIADSSVVFSTAGDTLVSINLESRQVDWQVVLSESGSHLGLLPNGDIYVTSSDGLVSRISGDDGSIIWREVMEFGAAIDTVLTPYGLLITSGGGGIQNIDLETGSITWRNVLPGNGNFTEDSCDQTCVLVVDGNLLTTLTTKDGELGSITVVSGDIAGNTRVGDNVVIAVTNSGDVIAWSFSER